MPSYPIPAEQTWVKLTVLNSQFITTASPAFSVEEARGFISRIRAEFSDASHNVPAFMIGYGSSVITHCSDDGEPSGTAGRPALAVLTGSNLGDIALVVTRYFGGTKLGTGGLVRAYGDSVRELLKVLPRARKVPTHTFLIAAPYPWYERLQLMIKAHGGQTASQDFGADVTLTVKMPVETYPGFKSALSEASHASLQALIIQTEELIVPIPP